MKITRCDNYVAQEIMTENINCLSTFPAFLQPISINTIKICDMSFWLVVRSDVCLFCEGYICLLEESL